jgi:hypothetical protein
VRARRRLTVVAAGALLVAAPATQARVPQLVYALPGSNRIVTSALDGNVVHRFLQGAENRYGLSSRTLAVFYRDAAHAQDYVLVYDAATGARHALIRNAFQPAVLADGSVAFWPDRDGIRDPQQNSVWLWAARTHEIHRVVQFADGAGAAGIQSGIPAPRVLSTSFSEDGRRMALAEGNDVDALRYDVWAVNVATGVAHRITTRNLALAPAISPRGDRIAYVRESASCPDGFRAASLLVARFDGRGGATRLLAGSCGTRFTEVWWIGSRWLVVRRTRSTLGGLTDDLVLYDRARRRLRTIDARGGVGAVSVSSTLRRVAYERNISGAPIVLWSLATGKRRRLVTGAALPRLGGDRTQ